MSERIPYGGVLARVEKPGRYVGGEWNEIRKDPARVRTKVVLAFPDVYEIGMSYLGQKILYDLLNKDRDVLAERVFAPWPDMERELRAAGLPLASLENGLPLRTFDVVGFSLLYELNYTNVLTILDLGGIPLTAAERGEDDPLVIAGGPAAFNPEPVAGLFDLIFVGDGEEGFPEIVRAAADLKRRGLPRPLRLRELARIEGAYVPSLYRAEPAAGQALVVPRPEAGAPAVVRKRLARDFARSPFPEKIVVPGLRVVFDRVAVEAARGCPQSCRFCQASTLYFPHRPKDADVIRRTALRSLRQTGYEDLSLSALSVGDHPQLEAVVRSLMDDLAREKISLSLSSLRPGRLSRSLVADILKVRKTGFTLVPEAGSERLRAVINKKLDAAEIRDALTFAFEGGWQLVKLYFMVGLPTETDEDLAGIVELVRGVLDLGRSILGSTPRVHVSVSSFIPKPHTPFQWLGMEDETRLAAKQDFLRRELRRFRSVEVKTHPLATSVLEAVFSRGDRRLGPVLVDAWRRGARFDGWDDRLDLKAWQEAFAAAGLDPRDYLRPLSREAVLPWDHIDTRLRKSRLAAELEAALRAERTPGCLERSCGECGGCDERAWKAPARPARIGAVPPAAGPAGEPAGTTLRYRAFYAKRGKARFLSHIDLIHIVQRTFRRAGIEVRKTQGFHPKMDLSYGPALPLGMEALGEVLEFRTERRLEPRDFLARVNRSAPPGLRFSGLEEIAPGSPSLHAVTAGLVYSLDRTAPAAGPRLSAREIRQALDRMAADRGAAPAAAEVRFAGRRVVFSLPPDPGKGARIQDLVSGIFGLADPVHLIRRDAVRLKN
ncbi:MAG TPA: TIGR03960 family B12-binding radical SAM protein [Candidatus Aminicenantes bacterium]|nr:TIGR03960 family B12-binding radical SAM protein [Candidatus Aminicenantes bacterium]HRY65523.1 TIGR03960 family B12-binding radical SAM protein [Candidatus Aminicenantes bacterium]HRZ72589.1 TIGR03960 family B12-binding radical SAM protein [Candidatus Aminicenantes bacterium]